MPCGRPPAAHVALEPVASSPTETHASPVDAHTHASKRLIEELTRKKVVAEVREEIARTTQLPLPYEENHS